MAVDQMKNELYTLPDHPIIRNLELTGYPDGQEPECPRCPICHQQCDTIYRAGTEIVGCDRCLEAVDAWKEKECF